MVRTFRYQDRLYPLGVFVALTFIGLPFVVRTVQPVLEDVESELEEAVVMLVISFVLLLIINWLQWWSRRRGEAL